MRKGGKKLRERESVLSVAREVVGWFKSLVIAILLFQKNDVHSIQQVLVWHLLSVVKSGDKNLNFQILLRFSWYGLISINLLNSHIKEMGLKKWSLLISHNCVRNDDSENIKFHYLMRLNFNTIIFIRFFDIESTFVKSNKGLVLCCYFFCHDKFMEYNIISVITSITTMAYD